MNLEYDIGCKFHVLFSSIHSFVSSTRSFSVSATSSDGSDIDGGKVGASSLDNAHAGAVVDIVFNASVSAAKAEEDDASVDAVVAVAAAASSHGFFGAARVAVDGVPIEILLSIFLKIRCTK